MIRVLLIDIGDVLVGVDVDRVLGEVSRLSGLEPQRIREILSEWPELLAYETGQISTESFFGALKELLGIRLPIDEFTPLWTDIFSDQPAERFLDTQVMRALRDHYRLVALSNTNPLHFAHLTSRFTSVREFDDYVLSFREGYAKPHPRIFQIALERCGVRPAETLLIDDRIENVRAATRIGIEGIVYRERNQLLDELTARELID